MEILMTLFIVGLWWLSYKLGASVEVQLYIVVALALMMTFGFYALVRSNRKKQHGYFRILQNIAQKTHFGHTEWWQRFSRYLDKNVDNQI